MSNEESNGYCPAHDEMSQHFRDFDKWVTKTTEIHAVVTNMHRDMQHLSHLPLVVSELKLLRESLVGPATNKSFVPLAAIIPLIAAMSFCCIILGGILLVHMSDDKSIKLNASSIEVLQRQQRHGTDAPSH